MQSQGRILLLPGRLNSDPDHWQSRWEARHGAQRVQQDDWQWPRRGDWMARLDEVLLAHPAPALLAAHSLGCHLVAAWAAHSRHTARVRGALLVAPPDTERVETPPQLFNWRPLVLGRLPFPSTVAFSSNDPFCTAERALVMARAWGSGVVAMGPRGHLNTAAGLGDWPEGRTLLQALGNAPTAASPAVSADAR